MRFRAQPVERIGGEARVPGDKSISHRALMLAAVAEGSSTVSGFLHSDDCLATRRALEAMGVPIREDSAGRLRIDGVGPSGLRAPAAALDLGNSGTAMRLLAGLLAGQRFACELTGDASLRARPMDRIATPLEAMGARIDTDDGHAPLRIAAGASLQGIDYALPMASAQVKSALLLAGLWAHGRTTVRSPGPSRDHTERMLRAMGVALQQDPEGQVVSLDGPVTLRAVELDVPGDFSSAAFFLVAGCFAARDGLLIRNVGVNATRVGLLTALQAMGARIEMRHPRRSGTEPVADLYVERSDLRGIDVPPEWVSLAIDELPVLFVAAAGARGETRVRGAEELRHKESDRLAVMAQGLAGIGVGVQERPDGLIVRGGPMSGGRIDSHGDHRIAMAFAIASLRAQDEIEIRNTEQVATSFPGFVEAANAVGLRVRVEDEIIT